MSANTRKTRTTTGGAKGAAIGALILACLIWGTSFLFGKLALREMTVSQLVLFRFGFGSLALFPFILARRARLDHRDLPAFILTGFLAVPVTFLLQFAGLNLTSVARASLIIGTIPPLLALGGAVYLKEHPGGRNWLAIGVSLLGVLAITGLPGGGGSWLGDGLVFLSAVVSVVWVIANKRLSEKYSATVATTYVLISGTLTLAPISFLWDGVPHVHWSISVWAAVLILGLVCTALAFVLWNWGLERVPASRAGVYLNLEPLIGAFLGVFVLGEALMPGVILGGIFILGGALLVVLPQQKPDESDLLSPNAQVSGLPPLKGLAPEPEGSRP